MQLMGTKPYPVRMFSDGMDDFVMDKKTMKMTPGVVGLHSVAMTTRSRDGWTDRERETEREASGHSRHTTNTNRGILPHFHASTCTVFSLLELHVSMSSCCT